MNAGNYTQRGTEAFYGVTKLDGGTKELGLVVVWNTRILWILVQRLKHQAQQGGELFAAAR